MLAIRRLCEQYIIPVISVVGIVCNSLNLLVLSRKHMKESPYTYLMGLAVTDTCVLVISLGQSIVGRVFHCNSYVSSYYDAYIFIPIGNIFANSSIWITVLLTIERWVSVRFPLQTKDLCTRKLARRAIIVTLLSSFLLNIPRFFSREVQQYSYAVNSSDVQYTMTSSEFGAGSVYSGIMVFYVVVVLTVPCIALTILNSCLVCLVVQARNRRNVLQQSQSTGRLDRSSTRDQTRLTITCISIIALFIVCMTPAAFVNPQVVGMMLGEGGVKAFLESEFWKSVRTISNTLVICNLSLNFVLYCLFNNRFRQTVAHLLRECVSCVCCNGSNRPHFHRRSSTTSTSYPYGSRHGYSWRGGGSRRLRHLQTQTAQVRNEVNVCVEVHPMNIVHQNFPENHSDD